MRGWDMTGASAKWQLLRLIQYGQKLIRPSGTWHFTGQAKSRRCKFCFSLAHPSEDCDWALSPSPAQQPASSGIRGPQRQRNLQICYSWNHSPNPICANPNCKYQHICIYCAKDPQATNRDHKALHCSRCRPPTTVGAQAVPPTTGPRNPGATNVRYQPY